MNRGFTLLEICLALFLAMMIVGMAIPSLGSLFEESRERASFEAFNALVQTARASAIREQRPWVLEWQSSGVVLRPQAGQAEEEPGEAFPLDEETTLSITFPAALLPEPAPVWTFWPAGICEPATLVFKNREGSWTATYEAFKEQAEVTYE